MQETLPASVDIRAGWFNYVFVGTELHRFHHSANLSESKNYAVTLSLIDIIFGTFYYRPGELPERLGVADPGAYPNSNEFWKVMKLPFHADVQPEFSNVPANGPTVAVYGGVNELDSAL